MDYVEMWFSKPFKDLLDDHPTLREWCNDCAAERDALRAEVERLKKAILSALDELTSEDSAVESCVEAGKILEAALAPEKEMG